MEGGSVAARRAGWQGELARYRAVPAVLIGWLGRDLAFRGQDIGGLLLRDAMTRVPAPRGNGAALRPLPPTSFSMFHGV